MVAGIPAEEKLAGTPKPFELESFLRDEAKIKAEKIDGYLKKLRDENDNDEEVLKRATDAKLEKWGVSAGGDRKRILAAIEKRAGKKE